MNPADASSPFAVCLANFAADWVTLVAAAEATIVVAAQHRFPPQLAVATLLLRIAAQPVVAKTAAVVAFSKAACSVD
jgi:hypothetical protein